MRPFVIVVSSACISGSNIGACMVCSRCVCGVWGEGVTGSEVGEEGSRCSGAAPRPLRQERSCECPRSGVWTSCTFHFVDFPAVACSPFLSVSIFYFFLSPIVSAIRLSLSTASALDWLYSSRLFIFTLVYIAA